MVLTLKLPICKKNEQKMQKKCVKLKHEQKGTNCILKMVFDVSKYRNDRSD